MNYKHNEMKTAKDFNDFEGKAIMNWLRFSSCNLIAGMEDFRYALRYGSWRIFMVGVRRILASIRGLWHYFTMIYTEQDEHFIVFDTDTGIEYRLHQGGDRRIRLIIESVHNANEEKHSLYKDKQAIEFWLQLGIKEQSTPNLSLRLRTFLERALLQLGVEKV